MTFDKQCELFKAFVLFVYHYLPYIPTIVIYKKNKTKLETLQHDISILNPMRKRGFHLYVVKNVLHFLKRYTTCFNPI